MSSYPLILTICLRKPGRPLLSNRPDNSNTFLWLQTVCTMSDWSSSNFSNLIFIRLPPPWPKKHPGWLKSHYAPDSMFEKALINKKGRAQTFSIYNMHYFMSLKALFCVLCNVYMENVEHEPKAWFILENWFIFIRPISSVDQSLQSQKCSYQEIWNCKAGPKTFNVIPTKINHIFKIG